MNIENTSVSKRKCVGCGAELSGNTPPDLCPKCLLKLAMETQPGTVLVGTVMLAGTAPQPRGLPQPGDQFGQYSIIRLLGAGGMGAVYEAQDLETARRVALKVLSHTLDSPEARERFFREGRLAASINHPNSVYIFGTEEIGGTPVIAMELLSGGTLQDRVHSRGQMAVGEAVDCVRQIIAGLEAAQNIGILHRDIKPSNCYVGENGTVKIGDFGLSISTAVRTEPALTSTGAFLGTPAFCSPEQIRGEELNARSDMYSVGATLFYLLTGHTPFEGKNLVQLLATVLEQRAPSPGTLRPDIPKGLAKVVLRCLEKHPGDRFKNYSDLTQALAPYSSTAPTPATLSLRFLAGVIDMVILCALALVINLLAFGSPKALLDQAMERSPKVILSMFAWFGFSTFVYYGLLEGLLGAAAGKAICRLRLVDKDRNPAGIWRAWIRSLIYLLPPMVPYWLTMGIDPKAYMNGSLFVQMLVGTLVYLLIALLFSTARRHNGFAAVQDLLTGTRVISSAAIGSRRLPGADEVPPSCTESAVAIGPYHVLKALGESPETKWLLAYDLKLLRKVWVRIVSPGTVPVPVPLRNLGRPGRLRWLTGKRSAEENWDAFEALTGRPFLELIRTPQPWSEVRYWLHDLAIELSAAQKDGSLPELALDRIWITGDGRAKLLDFRAAGLGPGIEDRIPSSNQVLDAVASTALSGHTGAAAQPAGEVAVPLPVHARAFLRSLSLVTDPDAIAGAVKPLLSRVAAVSRLRRAVLVAGCVAFPVLASVGGYFALNFMRDLARANPGLMDLNTLLQMRTSSKLWARYQAQLPTDRQLSLFIACHYRGLITNSVSWSNPLVGGIIKGEARKFAEQSVVEHPAPTEAEKDEADAAVGKYLPKQQIFDNSSPALPVMVLATSLFFYVCIPALVAALAFRGGAVLLAAGVTYAKKNGAPASRPRLFWRALVAWFPLLPVCVLSILAFTLHWNLAPWLALLLFALLALCSVVLPGRGIQDRLAGTWPVPR